MTEQPRDLNQIQRTKAGAMRYTRVNVLYVLALIVCTFCMLHVMALIIRTYCMLYVLAFKNSA